MSNRKYVAEMARPCRKILVLTRVDSFLMAICSSLRESRKGVGPKTQKNSGEKMQGIWNPLFWARINRLLIIYIYIMFEIDFDNLIIKKETIKDRHVFIIDNFYKNPNEILDYFKKCTPIGPFGGYYPGVRTHIYHEKKKKHLAELHKLFNDLGLENIFEKKSGAVRPNWWRELCISEYKHTYYKYPIHEKNIKPTANPHFDWIRDEHGINKLAGVCFLSKEIHGGTGFYRNKILDMYHMNSRDIIRWSDEEFMKKIFPYEKKRLVNKSCDKFELLKLIPMKWNRLILYDGDLLHSLYMEDEEFYKKHRRITTNYFLCYKTKNK